MHIKSKSNLSENDEISEIDIPHLSFSESKIFPNTTNLSQSTDLVEKPSRIYKAHNNLEKSLNKTSSTIDKIFISEQHKKFLC